MVGASPSRARRRGHVELCGVVIGGVPDAASAADCDVGLRAPLAPPAPSSSAAPGACGLGALCAAARLPEDARSALLVDLLAMGAVDVRELGGQEWQSLAAWAQLKPLERCRLESVLQGAQDCRRSRLN